MERRRLKLRPHYGWIGGIFVVGMFIVGAAMTGIETVPVDAAEKTIADITTMQEMTPEICAKMSVTPTGTESNVTLKDSRDGKSYRIAKLADGNCWMTENLRLEGGTKLKTTDSDLHVGSFNPDSGTTDTFTMPSSTSGGSTFKDDTKLEMNNGTAANGAYYTWCAATAGCKKANGQNPDENEDAGSSICPKGWKLPLSGSANSSISATAANGSFAKLLGSIDGVTGSNSTSMSKLTGSPYNFKNTAGRYYDGSLGTTTFGDYWSRTAGGTTSAYDLSLNGSSSYGITPAYNLSRHVGIAVRCVAANALETAETMQKLTADVCAKARVDDTAYLMDERDGKYYSIAKLKNATDDDVNCWMTSNLAFDLREGGVASGAAVVLDPATSDVTRRWPDADSSAAADKAEVALQNDGFNSSAANLQYSNNGAGDVSWRNNSDKFGFYYSWCAATANSCGDSTSNDGADGKRSASQSICPKGWKLPTGGAGGEYMALLGTSSWVTVNKGTKYNFYPAGGINSRSASLIGSSAQYWSSTSMSGTDAYSFHYSGTMYPAGSANRYFGASVRCVADPTYIGSSSSGNQQDSYTTGFSIEVKDAITVSNVSFTDADGREVVLSAMPGELVNGKINVNVGSNVKYRITMSSAAPDLASSDSDNTNKIPAITQPMTAEQLKSNYGWGVLAKNSDNQTDATTYTGLDATNKTFYTSDTPAGAATFTQFNVGVSVPPTLPADTYSTEVTVTAIANE